MVRRNARQVKSAAVITIKGPGRMTARGRRDLATWMRAAAKRLTRDGELYTDGRFTERFLYG